MLCNAELNPANPEPPQRRGPTGNTGRFVQAELGSDEIDVTNREPWPE